MQTPEQKLQMFYEWTAANGLPADAHNGLMIEKFLDERTGGVFSTKGLDWARIELAGQLHYLAGADVSAALAAGAEAQKELQDKQAAEEKERRKTELRNKLIAEQQARGPGVASSQAGASEVAAQQQRKVAEQQKAAARSARHNAFVMELRAANDFMVCTPGGLIRYGATNDGRTERKAALAKKYPEFRGEIK